MAFPVIPILALVLISCLTVYKYIVHPLWLSPLSRIPPAHWSSPISSLWILKHRRVERETPTVHAAHLRLGSIIRLAPNELSVNSIDGGLRTIYAGGYEKGDWYYNAFNNYGIMPMFAMPDHASHSKRKRMLSNIYAKSTLQSSKGLEKITEHMITDRMVPKLREAAEAGQPLEFYHLFCAMATDFVAAYVFGLKSSSNSMSKPAMGAKFFKDYKARQRYQFWPQEMPKFTAFMSRIGVGHLLVPPWVKTANQDIENWIASMCDSAEQVLRQSEISGEKPSPEDYPTVYAQLRTALFKEAQAKDKNLSIEESVAQNRLAMASEMLDHTLAGFDTSSITLTFLAYELSLPRNREWQQRLRYELFVTFNGKHDVKTLDSLPILHAILMETLRLHAAIPGNQPRITPPNATLSSPEGAIYTGLPPGVRVQSQAWTLHRNPSVFPEPETWNPARWIADGSIDGLSGTSSEAQLKEMGRYFWAFGSGGRMCVGSNLAMLDMKAIIAGVWSNFRTTLIEGRGMRHNGGYVAEPVGWQGKWCVCRVEEVKS